MCITALIIGLLIGNMRSKIICNYQVISWVLIVLRRETITSYFGVFAGFFEGEGF